MVRDPLQKVFIYNTSRSQVTPILATYCDTFLCQLRGLMFCPELPSHEGLLLVQKRNSRLESAIHMLWMRFDLAVFWINRSLQVVDVCLARRWHLIYFPSRPASFILEAPAERLIDFQIGDYVNLKKPSVF